MAAGDLLFQSPLTGSGDVVFGAVAPLPTGPTVNGTLVAVLPAMSFTATAQYKSHAQRPIVSKAASDWQKADSAKAISQNASNGAQAAQAATDAVWDRADKANTKAEFAHQSTDRTKHAGSTNRYESATRLRASSAQFSLQDTIRLARQSRASKFQAADRLQARKATAAHQDTYRDRRDFVASIFEQAAKYRSSHTEASMRSGVGLNITLGGKYQNAMRPPAGVFVPPVTPPHKPCYTPNPAMVFSDPMTGSAHLVFRCPQADPEVPTGTAIVPVKRAYIVVNNANLRRVSDRAEIPCYNLSLGIDADSWTWSFSATLHKSSLALVEPAGYGVPTELEVEVNGAFYRVVVESISRDREFSTTRINVSGRGKSAVLSDPYSPILTFSNNQMRTAQQLMNDALTDNGVSIGWEVNFGLADWPVPTGVFSHNGTYMSALKAIAEAAGGYIQPDPVLDRLYVKPRYPEAPWNWGSLTPDFSLPADVTAREGIVWLDKADYDGVYVSGVSEGVSALVRKTGTAGAILAPMVVDPLITDDIAARQRGISVLSNTGRVANVTLSLPVLAETGIITPGKIIDYVDGGTTRRGITRSVSVNVNMPSIRQTIEVETHVY